MFTGLIEEVGIVSHIHPVDDALELTIDCRVVISDMRLGDSICVSGVCLTATTISDTEFTVAASPETMSLTSIGCLKAGDHVNLERSLTLQTRLGGHMVQGHVDGTAEVAGVINEGDFQRWDFRASDGMLTQMVHKGSITVNGVSLTISNLSGEGFSVALIPKTIELTTFQFMAVGDRVNIETDVIGKYVLSYLRQANLLAHKPDVNKS